MGECSSAEELMERGYEMYDQKRYQEAVEYFIRAWDSLAEPREEWESGRPLWLTTFRAYKNLGERDKALSALKMAAACDPEGLNSRIPFLMGQMYLEDYGEEELAAKYFNKAWDLSEGRAFQGEDPKYVKFARGK